MVAVTDLGDHKVRKRRGQRLRICPFPQKPGWKAWGEVEKVGGQCLAGRWLLKFPRAH